MINWTQSSTLEYITGDVLPVDVPEGTRALNTLTGDMSTFVDEAWVTGWYTHYIDMPDDIEVAEDTVGASEMKGLPTDLTGKVGYAMVLNSNLDSWDLIALPSNDPVPLPTGPVSLTWAELVSNTNDHSVKVGDQFKVTDRSNQIIRIAYLSTPGMYAWYETMRDSGQLTYSRII